MINIDPIGPPNYLTTLLSDSAPILNNVIVRSYKKPKNKIKF